MTSTRAALATAAATLVLTLLFGGAGAAQVPPNERYLTFETDNFRVIFPEGWEPFARRAAGSAEWAYAGLVEHFIEPPRGRISLVISDNSDRPNASATPIPFNRVTLIATPHISNRQLNYYRDWLDVTLVHEVAHIFHLDRAAGIWSGLRTVFGRVPLFFPAFYQPRWVVEGLPTYYESRLTGAGRAYGGYSETLLSGAALGDDFLSVDAADGLAPVWPANQTPYAYGGRYFRALAEQHGDGAVADFAAHGAARLPYTLDWAAEPHFGTTLSGGWERWRARFEETARLRAAESEARGLTEGTPLSDLLWIIPSPRFSPDGRYIAYTSIGPRDDAETVVIEASSGDVVRRARRNSSGGNAWSRDGATIYSDQLELANRYRIYGDLYELDLASGSGRRLTVGSRVGQPDLAPDGKKLLVVQVGEGTNRLATIDLASGSLRPLTEYAEGVNWERPRWSPEGQRIAVERWLRGQVLDIVILDAEGNVLEAVTEDAAVDVAPCWSADGRYVLWSSDREGTFDIYAADLSGDPAASTAGSRGEPTIWRVTRTLGGGLDPDVAPDGRWLAFVAQRGAGFRIERIAFAPADWEPAGSIQRSKKVEPELDRPSPGVGGAARPYSPFPALWPKSWLPLLAFSSDSEIGTFVGATTFGSDDIGRHAYAVLAGWRTGVGAVQGLAAYIYRG
ncbi:MAG: PD40 domain-containing protein, partial [Gemmatimonadota bacterium]